ncbi:hypothetical protein IWQ62_002897 [Dispira parvispora]|uniref:NAD-dependent epimerase/dehydratase domain-containing protein n=1 Tax=Dispira parvispora TaxID=1520584 RepID=A0A9W8E276_9FUNG|nr:hypothetical protein IWQ62_002897 [Dispira parvispora]
MAQSIKKLLVVGGTGFLGSKICQRAVERGLEVVSLSRRGQPSQPDPSAKATGTNDWQAGVTWCQGDVLRPETYAAELAKCDAVVHTVGTLLEANYKGLAQSTSLCQAVSHLVPNSPQVKGQREHSYEVINRDTALMLAQAMAQSPRTKNLVYISASRVLPFIDSRYISTKREAEAALLKYGHFRTVILRPGIMYSAQQSLRSSVAGVLGMAGQVKQALLSRISRTQSPVPSAGLATPPLPVDQVALATVNALLNPSVAGVVPVDGIIELASRSQ